MSLNSINLTGNAVRDPETRTTPKGSVVSTIRLAHNDPLTDKPLYIDVDAWEKQGEFVSKYVKKGSSIAVTGKLKMDEWTDKEGKKQTKFVIVADRVHFNGGAKKKDANTSNNNSDAQSDEFDDAAFAAAAGIQ